MPAGCWIILLVLPALAPLARPGFFRSHDGLFHAYRLVALEEAVRQGAVYPRWFPELAFGYGHPVINFYGPLSYYWALPFTLLGLSPVLAIKLTFATGLIASALGMYLFARLHLERGPALVAAVVYAYLPYHLVDLYVRGALAEFLAFVWFPLVLWAFHGLVCAEGRPTFRRLVLAALLLVTLVLTHNLSALIFAPVLAGYLLVLGASRVRDTSGADRSERSGLPDHDRVVTVLSALAAAAVLSAFYWLPVLAEQGYVGLGSGASQGYREHLLPLARLVSLSLLYPYPTQEGVAPTFPLGLVQVLIALAALPAVAGLFVAERAGAHCQPVVGTERRPGSRGQGSAPSARTGFWPLLFFVAVTYLSAFMLITGSLPVWRLFEKGLAFLQYPWRFQALTALGTAFLAGAVVQAMGRAGRGRRAVFGGLLVGVVLLWALGRLPYLGTDPAAPDLSVEAMWQGDRAVGQVGATWTGEYLPIWVQEQRWALSLPATEPADDGAWLPAGSVQLTGVGYNRYDLSLPGSLPAGSALALHQFHYPGWQARWPGRTVPSHPEGLLGLAAFDLSGPAGPGQGPLVLRLGLTPAQQWGSLVSAVGFLLLGVALVARFQLSAARQSRRSLRSRVSLLALAATCLLVACALLAGLALPNGYQRAVTAVGANLEDTVELLAYRTDQAAYRPGDRVAITLYWQALRAPAQDYKAFVHLTDAGLTGQPSPRLQHDGDPGAGFSPTTRWLAGEVVPDLHTLLLPPDLPAGRYRLWAGMYEYESLRNLPVVAVRPGDVLSAQVPVVGDRVLLGEIEVRAP